MSMSNFCVLSWCRVEIGPGIFFQRDFYRNGNELRNRERETAGLEINERDSHGTGNEKFHRDREHRDIKFYSL